MFIKSLTLNGFKAFGDKTTIEFKNGIGALIGPNGSGKSNIIDAIKWVIGESKISEIRGDKLEDLIFHGSVENQQQNMAEVEMVIDNQKSILSVPFKEVSIIRRLYRSGATECFINRKQCRLRDIQEVFLNTGLGRGNYSVIPQGKIDQILYNKSNDRRKLLEESSSLSLYQEKKKEYESQISKTEENLKKIEILVKEEERKRNQLEEQSKKSEKDTQLKEEKKQLQIDLLLHELKIIKEQENSFNIKKEEISNKLEKSLKQLEKIEKEIEVNNRDIGNQFDGLAELEKSRIKKNEQGEALKKEQKSIQEQIKETERNHLILKDNLNHHDEETKDLTKKIKNSNKLIEKTETELKQIQNSVENQKLKVGKVNITNKDLENKIKDMEKALKENREEWKKANHQEKEIVKGLIGEIDQLKQKLSQEKIVDNRKKVITQATQIKKKLNQTSRSLFSDRKTDSSDFEILFQDLKKYFSDFETYFSIEDPFYHFFFSAEGTYSKKERLEKILVDLDKVFQNLEIKHLSNKEQWSQNQLKIRELRSELDKTQLHISNLQQTLVAQKNERQQHHSQIDRFQKIFIRTQEEIKLSENQIKSLQKQWRENEKNIEIIQKEIQTLTQNIDHFSNYQQSFKTKSEQLQKKQLDLKDQIQKWENQIQSLELQGVGIKSDQKNLYERGSDQFSVDLHQRETRKLKDPHTTKEKISQLDELIKNLGPTNPLAKVEYDQCIERLKNVYEQKNDIVAAMEDLQSLAQELIIKTEKQFLETFTTVKKHFSEIIEQLFVRGTGDLTLSNEQDPLNSEIDIWVKPFGKKMQKMSLFSGGEKTLIAVAFMFSFFKTKPSPLCLLDEVDAMLDSANIERFINLLKSIKQSTQLIFITHNQKTMQIFDYVYGISIREGKTKIISLKLSNHQRPLSQ